MLVLHDPTTLLHSSFEFLGAKLIPAKECPERITTVLKSLESSHHSVRKVGYEDGNPGSNPDLMHAILKSTHDNEYLLHLESAHSKWVSRGAITEDESVLPECFPIRNLFSHAKQAARLSKPPKDHFAQAGFYAFDCSAGIATHTWNSALASANLAIEGAKYIAYDIDQMQSRSILALCRPPGHHCTTSIAGGYCYLNNAVVAVRALQHFAGIGKFNVNGREDTMIAILDIDFHHGNGTQEYFYESRDVLYVSIHGQDEYPYYSGFEDETGAGEGKGFNYNLPLPANSSIKEYLEKVDLALLRIEKESPSFLVISLGFDTFNTDPLGSFKIYTEDYEAIASRIRSSKFFAAMPALILMEGGYVLDCLGDNVISFLRGWEDPASVRHESNEI